MYPDNDIVSDQNELLILVDREDNELGFASKADCHFGSGLLHRAFSVFIFNSSGQVLLQQRSRQKALWALYWSNSCCSHPRFGEKPQVAAERRLYEECGLHVALEFVFKFDYSALFGEAGAEHELCSVFIGVTNTPPIINTTEVSNFKWQKPSLLDQKIENQPHIYTPWFKTEWAKLRTEFSDRLPQINTIPN